MRVKLKHTSRMKGCEGMPGDVIEVPDEVGRIFIAGKGAVELPPDESLFSSPGESAPEAAVSVPKVETAAKRTRAPKGRSDE